MDSFPFFSLPEEIILKILQEYIPMNEKLYTLSTLPAFLPFLACEIVWFAHVIRCLKPGWYTEKQCPKHAYLVSVDLENLSFSMYHYYGYQRIRTLFLSNLNDTLELSHSNGQTLLNKFLEKHVWVHEISFYNYKRTYFSISSFRDRVYWWKNERHYPIKNNTCFIQTPKENLKLTLGLDRTILLECLGHETPTVRCFCKNISKFMLINPVEFYQSSQYNARLYDISFYSTFETDKITLKMNESNKILLHYESFGKKWNKHLLQKIVGLHNFMNCNRVPKLH